MTYEYNAWGKILDETGSGTLVSIYLQSYNHLKYRGYYHDTETGFYYLNSRYYDPVIGRFINADDSDIVLMESTSLYNKNLYAYCDNDSVNRIDIDGYMWEVALAGGGAMATGSGFSMSAILAGLSTFVPVGLAILGTVAVVSLVYTGVKYAKSKSESNSTDTDNKLKANMPKKPKKPKKTSRKSGKEKADDAPSWARYAEYDPSQSAAVNARRVLDAKYGRGHWPVGPNSEYSQITKWLQRSYGYK